MRISSASVFWVGTARAAAVRTALAATREAAPAKMDRREEAL
jgi:hypothetical protein